MVASNLARRESWLGALRLLHARSNRETRAAVRWLRLAARESNPDAEYNLGVAYFQGLGAKRDRRRAMQWFKRAARHGSVEAVAQLGVAFLYGQGVRRNVRLARRHLTKAGKSGNERGALFAALAYDFYPPRSGRSAIRWYERAASAGNVDAMVNLAVCLENGDGGRPDLRRALPWYRRAARAGDALAKKHLARLRRGLPVSSMRSERRRSVRTRHLR